jgi:hypothetical protein
MAQDRVIDLMRADKNDAEAEKKAAAAFYPKNLTHAGERGDSLRWRSEKRPEGRLDLARLVDVQPQNQLREG